MYIVYIIKELYISKLWMLKNTLYGLKHSFNAQVKPLDKGIWYKHAQAYHTFLYEKNSGDITL